MIKFIPNFNIGELKALLMDEVRERYEEGSSLNVEDYQKSIARANSFEELGEIYRELLELNLRGDFKYFEPSDWSGINGEREKLAKVELDLNDNELRDKVYGAWFGRCIGCMLGKPVEGTTREYIRRALEGVGAYPLKDYFPYEALREPSKKPLCKGYISRVERDDDIDYTILNLLVYEEYGDKVTSRRVALSWLKLLPYATLYTAERAAYRNLILGLEPPETANYLNPYREWIGAQIRADLWGYVSPSDPEKAVSLAFRDARISHTKNGIYGALYVAALISLAYVYGVPFKLVSEAFKVIPKRSRLREAIRFVVRLYEEGEEWEEAISAILSKFSHYHPVHTISNAAIVTASLLWGERDFERTVTLAVTSGLDTDCNGATCGSIAGLVVGLSEIPEKWWKPLNDTIASALSFHSSFKITELAKRALKLIKAALNSP